MFKVEGTSVCLKSSQQTEWGGSFLNSLSEARQNFPDTNERRKRKPQAGIPYNYRCKYPKIYLKKLSAAAY